MRLSSVVGLRPRRSAAPPAPRMRQLVLSSTARMCSISSAHERHGGLRHAAAGRLAAADTAS